MGFIPVILSRNSCHVTLTDLVPVFLVCTGHREDLSNVLRILPGNKKLHAYGHTCVEEYQRVLADPF